jgi:hypothetical protein
MKIPLSIKTTYLPNWGAYEGVRELLQNGRDAEVEYGAKLTVRYRKETGTVVIENTGCVLPYEALLLGHTTKTDRADLIGKFGEGLKLGVLALVRAGHSVKIRTGSEVWVPSIQRSETFKADVLVFEITRNHADKNRVQVEIGNLGEGAWKDMQECFLFLGTVKDDEIVKTSYGSLLIGPRFADRIYVKGIFVSNDPRLSYGYDLVDADIDRDRKMVSKYDLQYRTQGIWREALNRRPDLVDPFVKLLERESADVEGIDSYSAPFLGEAAKETIAKSFLDRHGEDALPVGTLGESQDVEHLGKKGVVCPKPLRAILEQKLGSVETNKARLREEATTRYGWHDLSDVERAHLERAIRLVNGVEPVTLDDIDVVDFRDEKLQGMFSNGRILLAKKVLSNRSETLETTLHEVAHRTGGDGEKSHVANIERIWSAIVERIANGEAC